MTVTRNALCAAYAAIGVLALFGTWGNNVAYLDLGVAQANLVFWQQTLANPASQSITVDILFLSLSVILWMLLEARRLAMRGVWLYVLFGLFVAIAAALPFFLIHRERAQAGQDGSRVAGSLRGGDVVGLALLAAAALAYGAYSLTV